MTPLSTATPDSLDRLFQSNPTTHTDAQTDIVVAELIRRRSVFASEEAAKAAAGKRTRTKPTSTPADVSLAKPTAEVDLDDL